MKDARPTSGRVLSALFNILGDIDGKNFLDLFSGTGRVGFEALKRGVNECIFVESVKSRAEEIKSKGGSTVLSLDIRRAVAWLIKREKKFDIIFADPPYNSGWCEVLPSLQNLDKIFNVESVFIIEHSVREPLILNNNPYNFEIISNREYGETVLTFLKLL